MNENICAISTSLGIGAISIVRCSGPDVIAIVDKIFSGKNLNEVPSHTIHYGYIVDNGEKIDEVLVSVMRAPKTFTKEDIVEINCHGGITTTNKVLEILLLNGCRLADPGEFTKKAFLNGRIDLVEAESINDLIESETEESRKYAMNRLEGNLSQLIVKDRQKILELQAKLEVNYDYPEYDAPDMTHELVRSELSEIKRDLSDLLKNAQNGRLLKNGIDVALVGRPNVGKSSILNHLLDENRAIVTDIAGTTRDIIEGKISISGIQINLIDTAGIRKTDDVVEKIGVDKSLEVLKNADLIIYVLSNNDELTAEDITQLNAIKNVKKIVFINKCDLEDKIDLDKLDGEIIVRGNTISPEGLDPLKAKIAELFNFSEIKSKNYNYLSNAREISLVRQAVQAIDSALTGVDEEIPLEMISVDIKSAFDSLGDILGVTYKDELLDELFSKFCLGK